MTELGGNGGEKAGMTELGGNDDILLMYFLREWGIWEKMIYNRLLQMKRFWIVALGAGFGAGVAFGGGQVLLSFIGGFLAVVIPAVFADWRRVKMIERGGDVARRGFSLWAVKFSLSFLLLALAARAAAEFGVLIAPVFIGGVVVGVGFNIATSVKQMHSAQMRQLQVQTIGGK